MNTITYKKTKYPTRTFNVICEGEERTYTIATDSLYNAIEDKIEKWGSRENDIDCQIYFYVEDEVINLSAEEICKNHLDIEMTFVNEE